MRRVFDKWSRVIILGCIITVLIFLPSIANTFDPININSNEVQAFPNSQDGGSNDLMAGWSIYKNEQYGYELGFPSEWAFKQTSDNKIAWLIEAPDKKVSIYTTCGSLVQKDMDLWNFSRTYGFQNIEGFEKDPAYIKEIFTDYGTYGVEVVYWVTLPDGEKKLSDTYVFFDTKPKSNARIVLENGEVDLEIFDEIIRTFRFQR